MSGDEKTASRSLPHEGWVHCPTTNCLPEATKGNCLSCPERVRTCPTCHGVGVVARKRKVNP